MILFNEEFLNKISLIPLLKTRFFTTLFLLFLSVDVVSMEVSKNKDIRIMLYEWYPYAGPKLLGNGLTSDILITAFENAGYNVIFEYFPWRRSLRNLELGTWDVLINLYHTEERATRFAFPKNHLAVSQYTLFALKNRVDIPNTVTLDQLKDLKVGLVEKASYGIKFDNVKDSLPDTFSGAPSEKTLFPMLLAGRLDIVPSDTIAGWFTLKNRTKKWKMVRTVKTDLFEKKKLFPVFTKKNLNYKQFISDWDASMNQMIVDGSLLELYNKHNVIYER